MKKEEISVLAQLLTAMRECVDKLEHAAKKKDSEETTVAKNELLNLQRRMKEMLKND